MVMLFLYDFAQFTYQLEATTIEISKQLRPVKLILSPEQNKDNLPATLNHPSPVPGYCRKSFSKQVLQCSVDRSIVYEACS